LGSGANSGTKMTHGRPTLAAAPASDVAALPVEAITMADAALTAFGLGRELKYRNTFCRANNWFHGRNSLAEPLADVEAGACCDGLQPLGVNRNQGAESTLAYLWMVVHNREIQALIAASPQPAVADAPSSASYSLQ